MSPCLNRIMKINKSWTIFAFRWLIPSVIAFTFLFLPDLINKKFDNFLATNWLVRIFFVVYLINPFIGMAKALQNKNILKKQNQEYSFYVKDKDTLSIMTRFAAIFTVISTSIVFFLGVGMFFPHLNPLIYIYPSIYTIFVVLIALYGNRLEKEDI